MEELSVMKGLFSYNAHAAKTPTLYSTSRLVALMKTKAAFPWRT